MVQWEWVSGEAQKISCFRKKFYLSSFELNSEYRSELCLMYSDYEFEHPAQVSVPLPALLIISIHFLATISSNNCIVANSSLTFWRWDLLKKSCSQYTFTIWPKKCRIEQVPMKTFNIHVF